MGVSLSLHRYLSLLFLVTILRHTLFLFQHLSLLTLFLIALRLLLPPLPSASPSSFSPLLTLPVPVSSLPPPSPCVQVRRELVGGPEWESRCHYLDLCRGRVNKVQCSGRVCKCTVRYGIETGKGGGGGGESEEVEYKQRCYYMIECGGKCAENLVK